MGVSLLKEKKDIQRPPWETSKNVRIDAEQVETLKS